MSRRSRPRRQPRVKRVLIVALSGTAGLAWYGVVDVLNVAGNRWQTLSRTGDETSPFDVPIVSPGRRSFCCGSNVPVAPGESIADDPQADIVVPEIDYVQNLRVEEAKRLLEETDRAADDVNAAVGYEDPSFFRRLFRRRTGLIPREYRRLFGRMTALG